MTGLNIIQMINRCVEMRVVPSSIDTNRQIHPAPRIACSDTPLMTARSLGSYFVFSCSSRSAQMMSHSHISTRKADNSYLMRAASTQSHSLRQLRINAVLHLKHVSVQNHAENLDLMNPISDILHMRNACGEDALSLAAQGGNYEVLEFLQEWLSEDGGCFRQALYAYVD